MHCLSLLLLQMQLLLDMLLLLQLDVTFVSLCLLVFLQFLLVTLPILLSRLHVLLLLFSRELCPFLGHYFHYVSKTRTRIGRSDLLPPFIQESHVTLGEIKPS